MTKQLRKRIHQNWPNATLLMCVFHILQQVWRWLHERKNEICKRRHYEIIEIMKLFGNLVYVHFAEGCKIALEDILNLFNSLKTQKCKKIYVKCFEDLCEISKG